MLSTITREVQIQAHITISKAKQQWPHIELAHREKSPRKWHNGVKSTWIKAYIKQLTKRMTMNTLLQI
jgi:hypothetical protein